MNNTPSMVPIRHRWWNSGAPAEEAGQPGTFLDLGRAHQVGRVQTISAITLVPQTGMPERTIKIVSNTALAPLMQGQEQVWPAPTNTARKEKSGRKREQAVGESCQAHQVA